MMYIKEHPQNKKYEKIPSKIEETLSDRGEVICRYHSSQYGVGIVMKVKQSWLAL